MKKYSMDLTAESLVRRYEKERSKCASLEALYRELAFYTMPRQGDINIDRPVKQDMETETLYDDTAVNANITLANGLQTNLTPPNVKWFNLSPRVEELNADEEVSQYLAKASDQVFRTLTLSNFSQQIHEVYMGLGAFGTACLLEDEDPQDDIRFHSFRVPGTVYYFEDAAGRVSEMMRCFEYTTTQAIEELGDNAGKNVLDAWKDKDYDKPHKFLHCVGPRHVRDVAKRDAVNMEIYSTYINVVEQKIVEERGYPEKAWFVVRWNKNSNDKHGFSPNMVILPTIKSANLLMADLLQASRLSVRPPLDIPYKGYMNQPNINPGKPNYRNQALDQQNGIRKIDVLGNFQGGAEMLLNLQESIKRAYYVNMFLSLENQKTQKTATEVAEMVNEKMSQLGPALKRIENELLQGIIVRTFNILRRKGKIGPPPQKLVDAGGEYNIAYVSRLELAQKAAEIQSLDGFMLRVGNAAQYNPEALDRVNIDTYVDVAEKVFSVPPALTRSIEEANAIRKARAEQAQAVAQQEAALKMSQAGKNVADAEKSYGVAKQAELVKA